MSEDLFDPIVVGKFIRDKRKKRGMTQIQLASVVKRSEVHICNIETGKYLPGSKLMKRIFEVLDCKFTMTVE